MSQEIEPKPEPFADAAKATRVAGWINVILPSVVWLLGAILYATANRNDRKNFKIDGTVIFISVVLLVPGIAYLWSSPRIAARSKVAMQIARVVGLVQLLGYGWNLATLLASDGSRNGELVVGVIVLTLAVASLIVVIACTSAIGALSRQESPATPA
jgi:uncharacterized membrane-anchored protein